MLSIHSSSSNRELCLRRGQQGYLIVELLGHRATAVAEVWMDSDAPNLIRFFSELADLDRPWGDKREWASMEGDLVFAVTCTPLGAVTFNVELSGMHGAPEAWSVVVGIATEFGQLSRIGQEAKGLLE